MNVDVPEIDATSTAILLLDYQVGILANYPDHEDLINRAATVLAAARTKGLTIGHVRVAFEDEDYARIPKTNKMFYQMASIRRFPAVNAESQTVEVLAPQEGEIRVRKTRVGAMSTTDLHQQLQGRGITTLVIAGIATGGVVLSTLRDAADKDYRVIVLKDLCRDADPQVHETLVEKLFPRQAFVITSDEFLSLIAG
jgi:nicotinamidase-related amidase